MNATRLARKGRRWASDGRSRTEGHRGSVATLRRRSTQRPRGHSSVDAAADALREQCKPRSLPGAPRPARKRRRASFSTQPRAGHGAPSATNIPFSHTFAPETLVGLRPGFRFRQRRALRLSARFGRSRILTFVPNSGFLLRSATRARPARPNKHRHDDRSRALRQRQAPPPSKWPPPPPSPQPPAPALSFSSRTGTPALDLREHVAQGSSRTTTPRRTRTMSAST